MNINNIRLCDLCRPFPQMSNLADQQMPHTCWQKCRKPADTTKTRWQTCRTTADKDADMEATRQSQCTTTLWSCQFHIQVQIQIHTFTFQLLSAAICFRNFARRDSTLFRTLSAEIALLTFNFDFRTHGSGLVSDATFCCHLVLACVAAALATVTRRK